MSHGPIEGRATGCWPFLWPMEIVPGSERVTQTPDGWTIGFEMRTVPIACGIEPIELTPEDLEFIEQRRRLLADEFCRLTPEDMAREDLGTSPLRDAAGLMAASEAFAPPS